MTSVRNWREAAIASHGKSALTARDLYQAEKAAYAAYDARVREMAGSGAGVSAHDGKNGLCILTAAISFLALGDVAEFRKSLYEISEKAAWDPVHYSPLSYGLQAVDGYLRTHAGRGL